MGPLTGLLKLLLLTALVVGIVGCARVATEFRVRRRWRRSQQLPPLPKWQLRQRRLRRRLSPSIT